MAIQAVIALRSTCNLEVPGSAMPWHIKTKSKFVQIMHDYEWGANWFNAIHSWVTYSIVMFVCITWFYPFLWATM